MYVSMHITDQTCSTLKKKSILGSDVVVLAQKIHLCNKGCLQDNHILDRPLK